MGEISLVRGIGVDIVKLERVEAAYERFGERFARRVLSADELATSAITASFIAKRFASKEAIAKALGSGFREGITMPLITVTKNLLNLRVEMNIISFLFWDNACEFVPIIRKNI